MKGTKIISMLFYFGWSDNQERSGGGIQLYNIKEGFESLHHRYFSNPNFEMFKDVSPKGNRLLGFVAAENSWHGVNPYTIKEEKKITRDVLQINIIKHTSYNFNLNLLVDIKNFIVKILHFKVN